MKYILVAVTAFLLAIVYVSAMPYFSIFGVTPDIILIFASFWVVIRDFREGVVVIPIAALCRDLLTSDPLGMSLIALAPIVVLAAVGKIAAPQSRFLAALCTVCLRVPIIWRHWHNGVGGDGTGCPTVVRFTSGSHAASCSERTGGTSVVSAALSGYHWISEMAL